MKNGLNIVKLTPIMVNELWKREVDFSNWLVDANNIVYINEILGTLLDDCEREAKAGSFKCDILATDTTTGERVIIENQFGPTDHKHLSQVMTYAAHFNARTMVWVATAVREEHRNTVESFNQKGLNTYLLKLNAFRIGDSSEVTITFDVIARPDFTKTLSNKDLSETNQKKRIFWDSLRDSLLNKKTPPFEIGSPSNQDMRTVAIGSSDAQVRIIPSVKNSSVKVIIYIFDNNSSFETVHNKKDEIEKRLGFIPVWGKKKKGATIEHTIQKVTFTNQPTSANKLEEITNAIIKMRDVFKDYL